MTADATGARRGRKRIAGAADCDASAIRSIAALGVHAALADRRARASRRDRRAAAASRSWRSGTAASCPRPTTSAAAASSSSPARTSTASGSPASSSDSATAPRAGRRRAARRKALLQLKRDMAAGKPAGIHARRPARAGAGRAARRGVAGEGDRQSRSAVSHRGQPPLDAAQLGPHADSRSRFRPWRSRSASRSTCRRTRTRPALERERVAARSAPDIARGPRSSDAQVRLKPDTTEDGSFWGNSFGDYSVKRHSITSLMRNAGIPTTVCR